MTNDLGGRIAKVAGGGGGIGRACVHKAADVTAKHALFFPTADPLTGTLLAFATYAIGFGARPIGGLVFGHFGDRLGRKRLLVLSLVLMGGATFAMGLLPTYASIGVAAASGAGIRARRCVGRRGADRLRARRREAAARAGRPGRRLR